MAEPAKLTLVPPAVIEDVVARLGEALARALTGETVAVAIVETQRDRSVKNEQLVEDGHYHQLNAGVARLTKAAD